MPLSIKLPDHCEDARSVINRLAEAGHRFTEYRVLGRPVVELECPCASADELPEVCPASASGDPASQLNASLCATRLTSYQCSLCGIIALPSADLAVYSACLASLADQPLRLVVRLNNGLEYWQVKVRS